MKIQRYSKCLRHCVFQTGFLFVWGICLIALSTSASRSFGQEQLPPKQEKSAEQLRLEYAKLSLQLAETELKLVEQVNQELEASVPSAVTGIYRKKILNMKRISNTSIERLKSNVAIGKAQLSMASAPSTGNPEKLRLRYAEEKIRLAKINLDAVKAEKLAGKEINELWIVREDLKYRMALVNRELLGSPEHLLTIVDSLQRQIDQLREDMITQDQRISAVEDPGMIGDR